MTSILWCQIGVADLMSTVHAGRHAQLESCSSRAALTNRLLTPDCLLTPQPVLVRAAAPMTGLLSRMNSLGPTGKAAHKLAQHLTRALSASRPGSPTAAAGGGGSGQFARFNSLLSAASGASSAAASPRAAHAGRAPQLSRLGSQAALPNGRSAALSRQQSGAAGLASAAGSPTAATAAATAGGGLSRQGSLASVLQAAAGEQQAGSTGALEPDAAAWARHFQQSQQVGGWCGWLAIGPSLCM